MSRVKTRKRFHESQVDADTAGDSERRSESGVVIALTAILMLALVTIVTAMVHFGYLTSMQSELQTAADAAALAGAGRLNSATSGWQDARDSAIGTLGGYTALASLGDASSLAISSPLEETIWEYPNRNLTVRIERGFFQPANRSSPARFTPWENYWVGPVEHRWQEENPGIPQYVGANAMRVVITRPRTSLLSSVFGGTPEYEVAASSIAVRGPVEPVTTVPFALPVCTLLNSNGEFQGADVCKADRIFTRVDRYCSESTSAPDCSEKTLPSMPYRSIDIDIHSFDGGFYDFLPSRIHSGTADISKDARQIWHKGLPPYCDGGDMGAFRTEFDSVSDHYGVVGMPGDFPDEATLREAIGSYLRFGSLSGTASGRVNIGDRFEILEEGLVTAAEGDAVWNAITGQNPSLLSYPDSYTEQISRTVFGSIERVVHRLTLLFRTETDAKEGTTTRVLDVCPANFRYRGICNSRLGKFEAGLAMPAVFRKRTADDEKSESEKDEKRKDDADTETMGAYCSDCLIFKLEDGINDVTPVWRAKIPVIAEEGIAAASCQGVGNNTGAARDPAIVSGRAYRVIGFVDAVFFDVDVGQDPPNYDLTWIDGRRRSLPPYMRFQEPCNNVRARLACESQFVPSSSISGYTTPRLVTGEALERGDPPSMRGRR